MFLHHRVVRTVLPAVLVAASLAAVCNSDRGVTVPPYNGYVAVGTWGGDNAAFMATDTLTHVHIKCTYGDVSGRIPLAPNGSFDMAGSYLLRAYPVAVGPTMPARFRGTVSGAFLTFTVTVSDTIAKRDTTLGPATVQYQKDPSMGPCPICRVPGMASTRR